MSHRENLLRIKAVNTALEELADEVVYVDGATVSLYIDRLAEEVRPTDDIDILIELINYQGYAAVEDKLRQKGFVNDWDCLLRSNSRRDVHGQSQLTIAGTIRSHE